MRRDQRGVVLPSPVMILSIIAVAMAGIAWVATRHNTNDERLATPAAHQSPAVHQTHHTQPAPHHQTPTKPHHHKPASPAVNRSSVMVDVFNNSQVSGLAATVAARAAHAGWQVAGADNWYGTIPASTVYYPPQLQKAGKVLALDLGIHRTMPAVAPMRLDRLTVILTGPLPPR
jgi:hypothetical protein